MNVGPSGGDAEERAFEHSGQRGRPRSEPIFADHTSSGEHLPVAPAVHYQLPAARGRGPVQFGEALERRRLRHGVSLQPGRFLQVALLEAMRSQAKVSSILKFIHSFQLCFDIRSY